MEILKFDGGKPSNKRNRLITAIAGAFFVAAVGSTFAANITINSNSNLEYGQGLTQAAACDSSMTITPTNRFVNESGSTGKFYIETITVADAATNGTLGLGGCIGKTLKISAYDSGTVGALFSCSVKPTSYTSSKLQGGDVSGTANAVTNTTNCGTASYVAQATGFAIWFSSPTSSPNVQAGNIYKLTVESN